MLDGVGCWSRGWGGMPWVQGLSGGRVSESDREYNRTMEFVM